MKTQTDKATPRPWKAETNVRGDCVVDSNGLMVVTTCVNNGKPESGYLANERRANTALIVRAVNEYEALCAVADAAQSIVEDRASLEADRDGTEKEQQTARLFYKREIAKARSRLSDALVALAKLREGK